MGNAASIDFTSMQMSSVDRASAFLFNKHQIESLQTLSQCCEERLAFTNFIKEGSWLDDVCLDRNFKIDIKARRSSMMKTSIADIINESQPEILLDYIIPIKAFASIKECIVKLMSEEFVEQDSGKTALDGKGFDCLPAETSRRSSLHSSKTAVHESEGVSGLWSNSRRTSKESQDICKALQNDYFDLEHGAAETGFSKYQILVILFLVLHPIYLRGKKKSEATSRPISRFCFMDQYGQCRCQVPCAEPGVSSPEACKAEELLLAAAAYFDEERMLRVLSTTPSWARQLPMAVEGCALGVAVSEVREVDGEFHFVYANATLLQMTGHSARSMCGKTFALLHGAQTEPEQVKRLATALSRQRSVKLGITHHRKNGSSFVSLMVVKPIRDAQNKVVSVLSVFFDLSRPGATMQELQQTDVLLALLPLLLTCTYDKV